MAVLLINAAQQNPTMPLALEQVMTPDRAAVIY